MNHSGVRYYFVCHICKQSCRQGSALKDHMFTKHNKKATDKYVQKQINFKTIRNIKSTYAPPKRKRIKNDPTCFCKCGDSVLRLPNFKRHVKRKHPGMSWESCIISVSEPPEKRLEHTPANGERIQDTGSDQLLSEKQSQEVMATENTETGDKVEEPVSITFTNEMHKKIEVIYSSSIQIESISHETNDLCPPIIVDEIMATDCTTQTLKAQSENSYVEPMETTETEIEPTKNFENAAMTVTEPLQNIKGTIDTHCNFPKKDVKQKTPAKTIRSVALQRDRQKKDEKVKKIDEGKKSKSYLCDSKPKIKSKLKIKAIVSQQKPTKTIDTELKVGAKPKTKCSKSPEPGNKKDVNRAALQRKEPPTKSQTEEKSSTRNISNNESANENTATENKTKVAVWRIPKILNNKNSSDTKKIINSTEIPFG